MAAREVLHFRTKVLATGGGCRLSFVFWLMPNTPDMVLYILLVPVSANEYLLPEKADNVEPLDPFISKNNNSSSMDKPIFLAFTTFILAFMTAFILKNTKTTKMFILFAIIFQLLPIDAINRPLSMREKVD